MHSFAYGHQLVFNTSCACNVDKKVIYVDLLQTLPKENYTHTVTFDSNQGRDIYLRTTKNIQGLSTLETWSFVVKEIVIFFCNTKTHTITYYPLVHYKENLMHYWLYHIVLPIYLTFDGTYYFLHAGSVIINNKATLFMGDSYAGKSTLTDFFLQQRHTLVSDDKIATFLQSSTYMCEPSHNKHRPYRELETLGIETEQFQTDSLEIGKMYWITPVLEDAPVSIQELKGIQKFTNLRYSTEMDIYINQKKRFEYLATLANNMPLYELQIPRDIERLPEVYEKIVAHATSQTEGKI